MGVSRSSGNRQIRQIVTNEFTGSIAASATEDKTLSPALVDYTKAYIASVWPPNPNLKLVLVNNTTLRIINLNSGSSVSIDAYYTVIEHMNI